MKNYLKVKNAYLAYHYQMRCRKNGHELNIYYFLPNNNYLKDFIVG